MLKHKKLVALIFGGEGYEHEVSLASARNLKKMIDSASYDILSVFIDRSGAWYITPDNIPTFPVRLGSKKGFLYKGDVLEVSAAIPCLHGDFGEDGTVQGALTSAGIPYVGQDVYASAVTHDKIYTKLCAKHLNVPTADFVVCDGDPLITAKAKVGKQLGFPIVIKPSRLGSSYGIKAVSSSEEFDSAYEEATKFSKRILIEKQIKFDHELECAYFMGEYAPFGRILASGRLYDYEAKYSKPTKTEVGSFQKDVEEKVRLYSSLLVELIGIGSLARIDYFITRGGEIYFNEINAFPGMTDTSLYPLLTEELGYKHGEFINLLLDRVSN